MKFTKLSIFAAGAAVAGIMAASGASAATCISLPSPNPGGIPMAGCSVNNGDNFSSLTDSASNASILWSGTTHTVPMSGQDSEVSVEAAVDHVFDQFVDLTEEQKLDGTFSAGGFSITNNNGGFGTFTEFDWSYSGSANLAILSLKIGNDFMILDIAGQTSGFAENTLILSPGGPMNPQGISHVTFWSGGSSPVSEPAVLGLALAGIGGIAWMRRRKA